MPPIAIDPLVAAAVVVATACTDAVYVLFTNAVLRRRRLPAASWSSIWYLLSSFAVINYTQHWSYRAVRGGGLVHRRLCHHHLSPSRPDLSDPAARFLAGVSCLARHRSFSSEFPLSPCVLGGGFPQDGPGVSEVDKPLLSLVVAWTGSHRDAR